MSLVHSTSLVSLYYIQQTPNKPDTAWVSLFSLLFCPPPPINSWSILFALSDKNVQKIIFHVNINCSYKLIKNAKLKIGGCICIDKKISKSLKAIIAYTRKSAYSRPSSKT